MANLERDTNPIEDIYLEQGPSGRVVLRTTITQEKTFPNIEKALESKKQEVAKEKRNARLLTGGGYSLMGGVIGLVSGLAARGIEIDDRWLIIGGAAVVYLATRMICESEEVFTKADLKSRQLDKIQSAIKSNASAQQESR